MTNIIYQIIGIMALSLAVISFQFKNNKLYLIFQCASSVLWATHFFLTHAWSGAIINVITIIRCIGYYFSNNKPKRLITCISIISLSVASFIISITVLNEVWWVALFCLTACISMTIAISMDNEKLIRYTKMCIESPCWLVNNFYYSSIGGILCEIFCIISSAIALIRWKLNVKNENNKQKND